MRYPCVDTTSERNSGRRQESLHAPNATSPAGPAGLVVEILMMTAIAGESSGLGLLRWFRGLGVGGSLGGGDLVGLFHGRRVGLVDHVVVGGLDVLVLVLVLHDAGDRGDGALEAAGLGALGDLELHPVVTDLVTVPKRPPMVTTSSPFLSIVTICE